MICGCAPRPTIVEQHHSPEHHATGAGKVRVAVAIFMLADERLTFDEASQSEGAWVDNARVTINNPLSQDTAYRGSGLEATATIASEYEESVDLRVAVQDGLAILGERDGPCLAATHRRLGHVGDAHGQFFTSAADVVTINPLIQCIGIVKRTSSIRDADQRATPAGPLRPQPQVVDAINADRM